MLSNFACDFDEPEATVASASAPTLEDLLVVSAKNGNESAFEILVDRYRRRIIMVALGLTHVQEDAEDIAQQSFQKAFVHLHTFQGKSSFSTWLTRIAINEALMFLRRRPKEKYVSIDDDSSDGREVGTHLEIPDSIVDPEACWLQREETLILSAAIGKLTPRLRETIELHELGELSTEETARRMGVSVAAVKGRLFQARKKLRLALASYMGSPSNAASRLCPCD